MNAGLLRERRFVAGGPQIFVPERLAERILKSRDAIEGERKIVTVLFGDVTSSTALIERLDPEAAALRLQPLLQLMADAIHRYDGTINHLLGDGVMALFGAPLAHEDHAVRACLAAADMLRDLQRALDDDTGIRVGINSGEVFVRSVGNDLSLDYAAAGLTVHLAARMEQLAQPGRALITEHTRALVDGFVSLRSMGVQEIRGLSRSLEVFELLPKQQSGSRWQVRARRGLTEFVGRSEELARLRARAETAGKGRGQVVSLTGEAGIGKSRLAHQFLEGLAHEGWIIRGAAASPYNTRTGLYLFSDLLRGCFGVTGGDSLQDVQEKVDAVVERPGESLRQHLSALYWVLDIPVTDPAWTETDPLQRRRRIVAAVIDVLASIARSSPLALCLEDLHWIDEESRNVLVALLPFLRRRRMLLLTTSREPVSGLSAGEENHTAVPLQPLPEEPVRQLLDGLVGADARLDPLKRRILERAEGHPLFVEEIVRSLAQSGSLTGSPGDYRPSDDAGEFDIPADIRAVVASRVDRLAHEQKHLLQTAAALGREVPVRLLQRLTGIGPDRLDRQIATLAEAGYWRESTPDPERTLTFAHALAQESVYAGILQRRRRQLHARIVEAMEAVYEARLDEHLEMLARHADRGQLYEKAATYFRRAGDRALEHSAFGDARSHYENALEALSAQARAPEAASEAIDVRLRLRTALAPLGAYDEIIEHLSLAEHDARRLGDAGRLAAVLMFRTNVLNFRGNVDEAIACGRHARKLAGGTSPANVLAANAYLAQAFNLKGRFRQTVTVHADWLDEMLTTYRHDRLRTTGTTSVLCLGTLAIAHAHTGDFTAAARYAGLAQRIAEEVNRPYDLAYAISARGTWLLQQIDFEPAAALLEQGVELCRRDDIRFLLPVLLTQLGISYLELGRYPQAAALFEQAMQRAEAMGLATHALHAEVQIARLAVRDPSARSPAEVTARALAKAENRQLDPWLALALQARAGTTDVRCARGWSEARKYLDRALSLARHMRARPLLAQIHAHYAGLAMRAGARAESLAHRRTAQRMGSTLDLPELASANEVADLNALFQTMH